jgi:hypothetical protein
VAAAPAPAPAAAAAKIVVAADDWTPEQLVRACLLCVCVCVCWGGGLRVCIWGGVMRKGTARAPPSPLPPMQSSLMLLRVVDVPTPTSQLALQTALAKHPSTIERAERWKLIAGDVPGKGVKECVAKFKVLREAAQKQGAL